MLKMLIILVRLGDILEAGWWVLSILLMIQFMSPPMQPVSSLLRSSWRIISERYCSLLDLTRQGNLTNIEDNGASLRVQENIFRDKVRLYKGSSSILGGGVVGDDII